MQTNLNLKFKNGEKKLFNENVETNHISNKSVNTFRKTLAKISAALIFRPCMIPESQNK